MFEVGNLIGVGFVCVYMCWGSICVAAKQLKNFRGLNENG